MKQAVDINVDKIPFKTALQDLAGQHGVTTMIDTEVEKQTQTAVSLKMDGTALQTDRACWRFKRA